ncbi:zinc finger CCCH domain-containing protein 32-like [Dorcoceras hygrometricum]|uniref:Zinc finger CCCH domain-containing protein 32-like n=1 Tax=Dorcoceras hygrometricum TaxID=472368 RepID=A0A2Z7B9B8_9LAMI|nr:zinc finger CCCH domain-containing protein 32-like [Dorcoceras hygrometricum]
MAAIAAAAALATHSRCNRRNSFRPYRCVDSVHEIITAFRVQNSEGIAIPVVDRIGRSSTVLPLKGHFPRGLVGAERLVARAATHAHTSRTGLRTPVALPVHAGRHPCTHVMQHAFDSWGTTRAAVPGRRCDDGFAP